MEMDGEATRERANASATQVRQTAARRCDFASEQNRKMNTSTSSDFMGFNLLLVTLSF
jgi:hypothetical protein